MTDVDCLARIQDPVTGEQTDVVRVPAGYCLLLIPEEVAAAHAEWRECAAVRIVRSEDGTVGSIEITDDLEWLTGPEAGE